MYCMISRRMFGPLACWMARKRFMLKSSDSSATKSRRKVLGTRPSVTTFSSNSVFVSILPATQKPLETASCTFSTNSSLSLRLSNSPIIRWRFFDSLSPFAKTSKCFRDCGALGLQSGGGGSAAKRHGESRSMCRAPRQRSG